ncbi:hypothetical protein BGW80DRAFT_1557235 [Lactifluus volemus]|nr:hypothetical protein BGW80DRAFT_1557235 [Lactifluus volemus]
MILFYSLAFVAPLVASVSALPPTAATVSTPCQSSIASVATSPDAQCINTAGLLNILVSSSGTSVIPSVNTWVLIDLGISSANVSSIIPQVQRLYPIARQIVCLNDTSDHQLCAVDQLYDIQNKSGTVSVDSLIPILPQLLTAGLPVYGLPQNLSCTNCTKEAYNIIIVNDPLAITSGANSSISSQCGASFIDGQTPEGISQTAAHSTLPKTSNSTSHSGTPRSLPLSDAFTTAAGLGIFLTVLL